MTMTLIDKNDIEPNAEWKDPREAWLRRNPPHPGDHIRYEWIVDGMTVGEAAAKLGTARHTLSRVLNGKAGISPAMALKLEDAGWSEAESWLRLQGKYDLAQARKRRSAVESGRRPSQAALRG